MFLPQRAQRPPYWIEWLHGSMISTILEEASFNLSPTLTFISDTVPSRGHSKDPTYSTLINLRSDSSFFESSSSLNGTGSKSNCSGSGWLVVSETATGRAFSVSSSTSSNSKSSMSKSSSCTSPTSLKSITPRLSSTFKSPLDGCRLRWISVTLWSCEYIWSIWVTASNVSWFKADLVTCSIPKYERNRPMHDSKSVSIGSSSIFTLSMGMSLAKSILVTDGF
ncbi:hypothetical protein OGAPHI_000325 [Ogataea philodendri]|uniref:Uncharacterized protein n=1 Tax=Ogataea philodendri TaxID=1378263 RepID=A0A9P8PHZ7_9ASCO|nr:uncharacterized protein OGAPHI_000325 [Ogataea philodendri]KAH3671622.1 hypothetical protein OGAPHI_000325 [Ogataea philodendri]